MRSDPARLVPAAQAGENLPALLDAAAAGRATHILRDEAVVAHLVPAAILVLDPDVEEILLRPVIRAEAASFSDEIEKGGYHHAGNTIGQILGWLWESGGDSGLRWLADYAAEVTDALAARRVARPPFDPFWRAVGIALDPVLTDRAMRGFDAAVRGRLAEFTGVFSAAELAGNDRHRDADDPWPDATARGRCFAKKRWADVRAGDFVPNHPGVDLDYDDGWCRVEQHDGARAVLRDPDGQDMVRTVDDAAVWLPTRSREPWQWGLPV